MTAPPRWLRDGVVPATIGGLGLIGVIIAFVTAGLSGSHVNWTAVGASAAALGPAATLLTLAALLSGRQHDRAALRVAQDQLALQALAAERRQADKVSAWLQAVDLMSTPYSTLLVPDFEPELFEHARTTPDGGIWALVLHCQNLSSEPVFGVLARVARVADAGPRTTAVQPALGYDLPRRWSTLPPTAMPLLSRLPMLEKCTPLASMTPVTTEGLANQHRVELWFTDARGIHWYRGMDGVLERRAYSHEGAGGFADSQAATTWDPDSPA